MAKKKYKTYAELQNGADEIIEAKVTTRVSLGNALEMLMQLDDAIGSIRRLANNIKIRRDAICDAASKYTAKHFLEAQVKDGIFETLVDLADFGKYVMVRSKDKPTAISGDNLTQAFLGELPKKWTRSKLELDVSGMNRLGVDESTLNEHGLTRKDKFAWREDVPTAADNLSGGLD